jgi:hypothetical protein
VRMMKEPVRARKAAELPRGMAPRPDATTPGSRLVRETCTGELGLLTDEDGSWYWAAQALVHLAEEASERNGIITGKSPVRARILVGRVSNLEAIGGRGK